MNLLIKPQKDSQQIVSVTPASAGWHYISFSAYQLAPGGTVTLSDNSNELCAVVLSGIVSAQTEGHDWKEIGQRMSVFEDAAPYAVYIPPRGKLTITAKTNAELGVADGRAKGELPARLIEPGAMRRSARGKGSNTRYVCDILPLDEPAESVLVVEVRTSSGHSSSYPPHKHDIDMSPKRASWRRLTTIESIRRRVLFSSASIATHATLMSPWPSEIVMLFWCLAATTPWWSLMVMSPITLM